MATVGGNLLQRTRCHYFYDTTAACNKRTPGAGCAALTGFARNHAILGTSPECIATNPSDMSVALAALDATVEVESTRGSRRIPIADFHVTPGNTPHIETTLAPDELITAVELPHLPLAATSRYRKVRDRASYAFALVSVAAALRVEDNRVAEVRLALGGVATRPWRATKAEEALRNAPATEESFARPRTRSWSSAAPTGQRLQARTDPPHDHRNPAHPDRALNPRVPRSDTPSRGFVHTSSSTEHRHDTGTPANPHHTTRVLGAPLDRVDGHVKTTGAARFSAEYPYPNLAHAAVVHATVTRGRITAVDTSAALDVPGVSPSSRTRTRHA